VIDNGAGFNAERFYYNIIYLFEDDNEWAQDMLDWWNEYVYPPSSSHRPYLMLRCSCIFGNDCQAGKPAPIEPQETKFQLVAQQCTERRALAAALSQTQASAPRDSEDQSANDSDLA
jgi:hypothetical protein